MSFHPMILSDRAFILQLIILCYWRWLIGCSMCRFIAITLICVVCILYVLYASEFCVNLVWLPFVNPLSPGGLFTVWKMKISFVSLSLWVFFTELFMVSYQPWTSEEMKVKMPMVFFIRYILCFHSIVDIVTLDWTYLKVFMYLWIEIILYIQYW